MSRELVEGADVDPLRLEQVLTNLLDNAIKYSPVGSPGASAQPSARVLVVDDDPGLRRLLKAALEEEGYDVRDVVNGRVALEVLADWLPHVIVLDLMMPDLDGWAFRAAQLDTPGAADVPVIVISAARDIQPDVLGSAAFLPKPFNLDQLLETVTEVLRTATA